MYFDFGTQLLGIVTVLSLALYVYMGIRVSQARQKFGVPAPATSGNPDFERVFRVQANTAEWLVIYLPALWLFSMFVHDYIAAILGIVWIVGRYVYMEGYAEAADKRSAGFAIQALATLVLLLGTLVGIIWGMLRIGPLF
jgi:glutathione S-transferase